MTYSSSGSCMFRPHGDLKPPLNFMRGRTEFLGSKITCWRSYMLLRVKILTPFLHFLILKLILAKTLAFTFLCYIGYTKCVFSLRLNLSLPLRSYCLWTCMKLKTDNFLKVYCFDLIFLLMKTTLCLFLKSVFMLEF